MISLAALFAVASSAYELACDENIFSDVPDDIWYTGHVKFCYNYGYMTGTADGVFSPASKVTRGMVALTLYNIDNCTYKYTSSPFVDVAVGKWYHNGCTWAYYSGIVEGIGYGRFAPNDNVTNEQLCVMFMKYAQSEGISTWQRADLTKFPDGINVSKWAGEAVCWAVGSGVYGASERLNPGSAADRATLACFICNFEIKYHHNYTIDALYSKRDCATNGSVSYKCAKCGVVRNVTLKAWHNLNAGVITKTPTCMEEGVLTKVCRKCGKWVPFPAAKTAHQLNAGVITKIATCTEEGVLTKVCQVCGKWFPEPIPKNYNNHRWNASTGKCSDCGCECIVGTWYGYQEPVYFTVDRYGAYKIYESGVMKSSGKISRTYSYSSGVYRYNLGSTLVEIDLIYGDGTIWYGRSSRGSWIGKAPGMYIENR